MVFFRLVLFTTFSEARALFSTTAKKVPQTKRITKMLPAKRKKDSTPSTSSKTTEKLPAKKKKVENSAPSTSSSSSSSYDGSSLIERFKKERLETAPSILEFKFNKKRVRTLSETDCVPPGCKGIAYWMFRDERVQDNWALLFAQRLALQNEVPLHVCFCLLTKFLDATIRHFIYLLKGLREVRKECEELNIQFHILYGCGADVMPSFIEKHKLGALVVDFFPVRKHQGWVEQLKKTLPDDIPLCQVDAHNIVPCWEASNKLEYGARTIRPKITNKLAEYLTPFPAVCKHPYSGDLKADEIDWQKCEDQLLVDRSIGEVEWIVPGYTGGMATLESFINERLKDFALKRNDPNCNVSSNLSPYLHFGQISAQRCILAVKPLRPKYPNSVDSYVEEAIIRRELSDNFCFYNPKYDSLEGTNDWAKITLNLHKKDKREYLYTRDQLDRAKTHDVLWNAAQTQLVVEGKMHGFLRMYWAKKILEWTATPEEALAAAIYLNDRYSLDGRDPNGFVGCMWSICGIHDQGWAERPIFGKIRYMNFNGCKRKFDIDAFVARYRGKNSLKEWLTRSK